MNMGWADKVLKQRRAEELAKEMMSTQKFQEWRKRENKKLAIKAYCKFLLVGCDYLQLKHGYKKKGLMSFLKYATDIILYTQEDADYFDDIGEVMVDEANFDAAEYLREIINHIEMKIDDIAEEVE